MCQDIKGLRRPYYENILFSGPLILLKPDHYAPLSSATPVNPKWIGSHSPRLRGTSYPGKMASDRPLPQRGCICCLGYADATPLRLTGVLANGPTRLSRAGVVRISAWLRRRRGGNRHSRSNRVLSPIVGRPPFSGRLRRPSLRSPGHNSSISSGSRRRSRLYGSGVNGSSGIGRRTHGCVGSRSHDSDRSVNRSRINRSCISGSRISRGAVVNRSGVVSRCGISRRIPTVIAITAVTAATVTPRPAEAQRNAKAAAAEADSDTKAAAARIITAPAIAAATVIATPAAPMVAAATAASAVAATGVDRERECQRSRCDERNQNSFHRPLQASVLQNFTIQVDNCKSEAAHRLVGN
jgi:hypothetical protein